MRRLTAFALVLLPVLAHGQASLQAKVTMPAVNSAVAASAAKPVATPAALPTADEVMVPVNETVVEKTNDTVVANDSTLKYDLLNAATPPAAPKLIKTTPITLTLADVRSQAAVSTVIVHLTVDAKGVPSDLSIARSAGAAVDRRALEAVAQYRFKPATQNGLAVAAPVDVEIKLKKS